MYIQLLLTLKVMIDDPTRPVLNVEMNPLEIAGSNKVRVGPTIVYIGVKICTWDAKGPNKVNICVHNLWSENMKMGHFGRAHIVHMLQTVHTTS